MANIRSANLQNFHVGRERIRDITAFLDEQGNSRVLIDGRVQPVRYTHETVVHNAPQALFWDRVKYINARKN